jgi:hypothetical protein
MERDDDAEGSSSVNALARAETPYFLCEYLHHG